MTTNFKISVTERSYDVSGINVTLSKDNETLTPSDNGMYEIGWEVEVEATIDVIPSYATNPSYSISLASDDSSIFDVNQNGKTATFKHQGTTAGEATYKISVATDGATIETEITLKVEAKVVSIESASFDESITEPQYYKTHTIELTDELINVTYDSNYEIDGKNFVGEQYDIEFGAGNNIEIINGDDNKTYARITDSGEATINATVTGRTSGNEIKTSITITNIRAYVEGIELVYSGISDDGLYAGDTFTVSATITNEDAYNTSLEWIYDSEYFIVNDAKDENGEVIEGVINVTARIVTEETTATITAKAKDQDDDSVTSDPLEITISKGYTIIASFTDPNGWGTTMQTMYGWSVYIIGSWDGETWYNWIELNYFEYVVDETTTLYKYYVTFPLFFYGEDNQYSVNVDTGEYTYKFCYAPNQYGAPNWDWTDLYQITADNQTLEVGDEAYKEITFQSRFWFDNPSNWYW